MRIEELAGPVLIMRRAQILAANARGPGIAVARAGADMAELFVDDLLGRYTADKAKEDQINFLNRTAKPVATYYGPHADQIESGTGEVPIIKSGEPITSKIISRLDNLLDDNADIPDDDLSNVPMVEAKPPAPAKAQPLRQD